MDEAPSLDNNLYHIRGNRFVPYALPSLEVFRLPPSSPAFPGWGLRATANLPVDTVLGYYAGVYRHMDIADTTPYSFEVNEHYIVDALHHRNVFAYMNDPRGSGHGANVQSREVAFPHSLCHGAVYHHMQSQGGR